MRLEEKKYKYFFKSKFILALFVTIFFIIAFYATSSLYQNYQIRKEIAILDKLISDLNNDNKKLKSIKDKLADSDFIEREAKLKLNFKKEGEEVIVLLDNKYSDKANESENKKNEQLQRNSNVKKWINLIFLAN